MILLDDGDDCGCNLWGAFHWYVNFVKGVLQREF